ncbi:hypothetical protein WR25_07988 [Diploscapter pachys]|uniref:Uncharacterized protein n=1 Tax=Diploscapter pachys TaxID=2018661 RepID=A0A2A2M5M2_9BILA|nr:hypothetical protein WR25_07988 [Diploscapter pachys]
MVGCTSRPSMRASGRSWRARDRIALAALCTAGSVDRLRRTPSTSDLCGISGERIFSATVAPRSSSGCARSIASCASRACITGAEGMP